MPKIRHVYESYGDLKSMLMKYGNQKQKPQDLCHISWDAIIKRIMLKE